MKNATTLPRRPLLVGAFALLFAAALVGARPAEASLAFSDDFPYALGNLVPQGGWAQTGAVATNPIQVTATNQVYPGYPMVTPDAVSIMTSGQDVNHSFSGGPLSGGSVYGACLVSLSTVGTGDYFFHLTGPTVGSDFYARVFAKSNGAGAANFGVRFSSGSPPTYAPGAYALATTHLLVVKYTFNAGNNNDRVDLFIDPVVSATEPASDAFHTDAAVADLATINFVAIRQGSTTAGVSPAGVVDGLRVATTWCEAVGATPDPTTTTLTTDIPKAFAGQKVNLRAEVSPAIASGMVEFYDGATLLGTAPLVGGVANLSILASCPPPGIHSLRAVYLGETCYQGSEGNATLEVNPAPTTTDLFVNPPKTICGEKVELRAKVSPGGATGTVEFFDGATSIGTAPVDAGGLAVLSITTLSGGLHSLTAKYSGDACYASSESPKVTHEVNPGPTTTDLTVDPPKTSCGEKVTLVAQVLPPGATGAVQFFDGPNPLDGPQPLDASGRAVLSWTSLTAGIHSLSARYLGDACYGPSQSPDVQHEVNPVATTTDLAVDPPKTFCGEKVTLTAFVNPPGATGSVDFFDGGNPIGSAPVVNGQAVLSITTLAVGIHILEAKYTGDGCYLPSGSPTEPHEVNPAPTTTTLTSQPPKSVCGQKVTLVAQVNPVGATGTVEFIDLVNGSLGVAPVDALGRAVLSISTLSVGKHDLIARYSGDGCYLPSQSATYSHEVNLAPSTTQLFVDPAFSRCTDKVTLTARVNPLGATGTVQFFDGVNPLGPPVPVDATGRAELSISTLAVGPHSLSAQYSGDGCYTPSTSNTVSHNVQLALVAVHLTSDANPAKVGTKVTLTSQVEPADATGVVEFYDGATLIGSAPLVGGVATLSVTTFGVGPHTLHAHYVGDGCYAPGDSPNYLQQIVSDSPPQVYVIYPNGGENLLVGDTYKLQWSTSDENTGVTVTLCISRDNGTTWEIIAADIPDNGTYMWTVTPPGTNTGVDPVYSALFRVKAKDEGGQEGEDTSDDPFSIYDLATETVVTRLEASPGELGVTVKWQLGGRGLFGTVELERSEAEVGPWRVVEAQRHEEGDLTVAEDRTAEAGRKYWYRLIGVTNTGVRAVLGTVAAEAASFKEFALGRAWPNPSRGERVQVEFVVAREAGVKLSVVDVTGREVEVLAEGTYRPGRYQASWDERTERGPVAAGVYFLRFEIPGKKALVSRIAVAR